MPLRLCRLNLLIVLSFYRREKKIPYYKMSKKMSSTLCKYKRRLTNAPANRNEANNTITSPELSTPEVSLVCLLHFSVSYSLLSQIRIQ